MGKHCQKVLVKRKSGHYLCSNEKAPFSTELFKWEQKEPDYLRTWRDGTKNSSNKFCQQNCIRIKFSISFINNRILSIIQKNRGLGLALIYFMKYIILMYKSKRESVHFNNCKLPYNLNCSLAFIFKVLDTP